MLGPTPEFAASLMSRRLDSTRSAANRNSVRDAEIQGFSQLLEMIAPSEPNRSSSTTPETDYGTPTMRASTYFRPRFRLVMVVEKAGKEHEPTPVPAATQAIACDKACDLLARGDPLAPLSNPANLEITKILRHSVLSGRRDRLTAPGELDLDVPDFVLLCTASTLLLPLVSGR